MAGNMCFSSGLGWIWVLEMQLPHVMNSSRLNEDNEETKGRQGERELLVFWGSLFSFSP